MKTRGVPEAYFAIENRSIAGMARARMEHSRDRVPSESGRMNIRLCRRIALIFFAVVCLHSSVVAKRKDDVVVLHNGDRMTGEVKSLDHGILSFKADYMAEAVRLDWKRVARVESKDYFIITLTSGNLYTGLLELAAPDRDAGENFVIRADKGTVKVSQDEVISVLPTEGKFHQQLNGKIDYGFGYTSGNSQYQSNLSASTNYRRGKHYFAASTNITLNGQTDSDRTARYSVDFGYRRLFRGNWFAATILEFLRSEQQSLDLRATAGGLLGRSVVVTDRTNLSIGAGMVVSRERYNPALGVEPRSTNVEALVGMDFFTFRFKTTDISTRVMVYPNVTEPGRVRLGMDSSLRIEIFKDFYWGLTLYENFDSRPPVNFKRNDLGVNTSFGWKF